MYLADYPITSPFGPRSGGHHNGVDFGTPIGTPIPAVEGGTVALAQPIAPAGPSTEWDKCVIIQHEGGYISYNHLHEFKVTKGQRVAKGDIIALSGNTGYSFGPHLHIEEHTGTFVRFLSDGPVKDITPRIRAYKEDTDVTHEENFANCFITRAHRWPTKAEIEAWRKSGLAPYTWVQRHAPNPTLNDRLALELYQRAREKAGSKYPGGAEKFAEDRLNGGSSFAEVITGDMAHYVARSRLAEELLRRDVPEPLTEQDQHDLETGRAFRALVKEVYGK